MQLNFERYTAQGKYYKLLHSPTYIQHDLSENWYLLMKIPLPLSCHDDSVRAIYEIFLVAVDQWPYNTNENYNVHVNGIDSMKNSLYRKKALPLQWKWGIISVITIYLATGIQTKALTFVYPKNNILFCLHAILALIVSFQAKLFQNHWSYHQGKDSWLSQTVKSKKLSLFWNTKIVNLELKHQVNFKNQYKSRGSLLKGQFTVNDSIALILEDRNHFWLHYTCTCS